MLGITLFAAIGTGAASGLALVTENYILAIINLVLCYLNCQNFSRDILNEDSRKI